MSRRAPGKPTKRRQRLHLVGTSNGKHAPEPSSPTPLTAGPALTPPADPPQAVDRFPHDRPAALTLADLPATSPSRKVLATLAGPLVGLYIDAINQLREIAERCLAKGDHFNAIHAQKAVGALSLKGVEQSHGRKLTVDVNARNQEDLADWNSISPATRELLETAWDALEREHGTLPGHAGQRRLPDSFSRT